MTGLAGIGELKGLVGENTGCGGGTVVAGDDGVVVVAGWGWGLMVVLVLEMVVVVVLSVASCWPPSGRTVTVVHAGATTAISNAMEIMEEVDLLFSGRGCIEDPGLLLVASVDGRQ